MFEDPETDSEPIARVPPECAECLLLGVVSCRRGSRPPRPRSRTPGDHSPGAARNSVRRPAQYASRTPRPLGFSA